jgi:pilus assembly protein FimV
MVMPNCYRALLLVLLGPTAALALGLGDVHLNSALNAPLDADIEVVGASPADLSSLKAALASRETFSRHGLDYPAFLSGITVVPQQTADGRTILHLHSTDPVNEPFATVLVEVDWSRGHLVHEYTVLLDPPVFASETPSATTIAAPVTGAAARSANIERAAPSAAPMPASSASAAPTLPSEAAPVVRAPVRSSAPASSSTMVSQNTPSRSAGATPAGGGSYVVRNGDTLTSITAQVYGAGDHAQRQRELVGVYRANTAAFDGNMNLLRAGSRLSLPGEAELVAISPAEAAAEVHRQYSTWNANHANPSAASTNAAGAGQLRLVPPQEAAASPPSQRSAPGPAVSPSSSAGAAPGAAAGTSAAASAAATAELQQRLSALESQLAESQRLLQLRNAELAALQARAAPNAAAPAASAPPVTSPAPAAPAAGPSAAAPSAPAPASAARAPSKVAPVAVERGNSLIDLLEQYWYLPAALVAVLITLLVLRAVRARQEDAFDRSLGRLAQPAFESSDAASMRTSDTVPVRALTPPGEEHSSYRVEESGVHEQPAGLADRAATTGQHVAIGEHVAGGEAPVALDQGDPLAEADFHMAYGLYDQAADLVQIAIGREPTRRDLKLKLLEVYFVWGNKERFLSSARELAATRAQALPGEWEKIVIMGRQIAPDDALFGTSGSLQGAASGGVDLNLEGGQNRIDFDLMGEPTVAPHSVDLDLGAALGDTETTGENTAGGGSTGIDFVFDDAERGNETTGSTREMPGTKRTGSTVTGRAADAPLSDPDADTVQQPQMESGDHPTIRQKLDAATRGAVAGTEQTAELELQDLGLDLGPMEGTGEEIELTSAAEAPTMLAGLDEDTRRLMARAESEREGTADETVAAAAPTDSGTWLFTDTDFANAVPPENRGPGDAPTEVVTQLSPRFESGGTDNSGATVPLGTLKAEDLDLELGDTKLSATQLDANGLDLDVGTPVSNEGTFVQTQRIMAEDVPLPELEPATMSEVGTKLDLARAYMDMGDPEGARSILSEVLLEGSVSQKQEARRLIDTLPG